MRVLVTGGAGYIGSVVATTLLERGDEVYVLDSLVTGHRDAVPAGAGFSQLELREAGQVLEGGGFDAVVHLAARSLVGESETAPELYWRENVGGSLALLQAMSTAGVDRLVFSSTAATYGEPAGEVITEDTPTAPTNAYGASKLAVDHMIGSFARAHGLRAVSLRYFNVAGAHRGPEGWVGERHRTETHLIPLALQAARGEREGLVIHGEDYPTPDGTCVRDYIHVTDLAEAHLRALDHLAERREAGHLVCNLGTGRGYSVREVVEEVRSVTDLPTPAEVGPPRPGDPARLVASSGRAREVLGWEPRRGLAEMVADAWECLQQQR